MHRRNRWWCCTGSTQMAQIEIIGDDGNILINDEYKNLVLLSKQTVTFPGPPGSTFLGSLAYVSVPATSNNVPVMAISSTFLCSQSQCTYQGGNWVFQLSCAPAGIGQTATVYFYAVPEEVPNANGQVQLFNGVGKLVFDSNLKYMKMEKPFFVNDDGPIDTPVTVGRSYAVIHSKLPSYFSILPGTRSCGINSFAVDDTSQLNGTLVGSGFVRCQPYVLTVRSYCTTDPGSGRYRTRYGVVMIIDVTGV